MGIHTPKPAKRKAKQWAPKVVSTPKCPHCGSTISSTKAPVTTEAHISFIDTAKNKLAEDLNKVKAILNKKKVSTTITSTRKFLGVNLRKLANNVDVT